MDQNFKDVLITCLEWLAFFILFLGILISAVIYLKEITRKKAFIITSKANDNGIKFFYLSIYLSVVCFTSISIIEDPTKIFFTIPLLIFAAIFLVILTKITIAQNEAFFKMVENAMNKIKQTKE